MTVFVVGHILRSLGDQYPVEENALHPLPPKLIYNITSARPNPGSLWSCRCNTINKIGGGGEFSSAESQNKSSALCCCLLFCIDISYGCMQVTITMRDKTTLQF